MEEEDEEYHHDNEKQNIIGVVDDDDTAEDVLLNSLISFPLRLWNYYFRKNRFRKTTMTVSSTKKLIGHVGEEKRRDR